MSCMACQAASRDALDLLQAAEEHGIDGRPVTLLIEGMDPERLWRVLLYQTSYAPTAVSAYAGVTGFPPAQIVAWIRENVQDVQREIREEGGNHDGC